MPTEVIYTIIFAVGILFGAFVAGSTMAGRHRHKRIGKLRMDNSTGDTFLFMELEVTVSYVLDQDEIVLEVDLSPLMEQDTQE